MKKKYLIASIIIVLFIFVGITIAYFSTQIVGTGKNIVVNTKELKIVFTDSPALSSDELEPGWSTTKTFTVQNLSDDSYNYDIIIRDLINTFVTEGYLQYKITSTNGGYTCDWTDVPKSASAADTVIGANATIAVGVTQSYTLHLRYLNSENNQNADQGKVLTGRLYIVEHELSTTLVDVLLDINTTRLTRNDFSDVFSTENIGTLYTTTNTEDGSTVYYFAGNALYNWVKFGKCTSEDYNCTVGDDLYWRIIRTNTTLEDGGVRLLYAGSGSVDNQNAYIGTSTYSEYNNNPMYVGYAWGTTGSLVNNRTNQINLSNVASEILVWYFDTFDNDIDENTYDYEENLLTNYISPTAIYCNDRSIGYGTYSLNDYFDYGFTGRINNDANAPSLACGATQEGYGHYFETTPNIADKYTGSQENSNSVLIGNGILDGWPAGLMTGDEIMFAGGKYYYDSYAWYRYNASSTPNDITGLESWWLMSPFSFDSFIASETMVTSQGMLFSVTTDYELAIRPVISLKADVLWNGGDGSPEDPFEVALP